MDLLKETVLLQEHIHCLKSRYLKGDPPGEFKDKAFFNYVKENTAPIYELLSNWEPYTLSFLKNEKTAPVHPHQIISTTENIELIIMHSYYMDVKEKRYMELNISINYVLGILADYIRDTQKAGEAVERPITD